MNPTEKRHTYLIGEIGQNHNGSVDIAKLIVDSVSKPYVEPLFGYTIKAMDAVKLTKRDLASELSNEMKAKPYTSVHSFGSTYGEHRAALELSNEQHEDIYHYAKGRGLDVIETLCHPSCLSLLAYFIPDSIKVASRDLTNLPLLNALAETKIPIILSTGMAGEKELEDALDVVVRQHEMITILHCVSEYPTNPGHANLLSIKYLKTLYPKYRIGYSDHTIGISAAVGAVALGAEVIEKHVTIDRDMKGSDQLGSLERDGIRRFLRDVYYMELSLGCESVYIDSSVLETKKKLERSIAAKRDLGQGSIITQADIHLLSPGDGIPWSDRASVVGATLIEDIKKDDIIYPKSLKKEQ